MASSLNKGAIEFLFEKLERSEDSTVANEVENYLKLLSDPILRNLICQRFKKQITQEEYEILVSERIAEISA